MSPYQLIQFALALTIAGIAAVTDFRTRRIPNRLTFGGLGLALLVAGVGGGARGLTLSATAAFATALIPLILFKLRAMGGGDVKLFFSLGAALGVTMGLECQMIAFMAGAAGGIGVWAREGRLLAGLKGVVSVAVPVIGRRGLDKRHNPAAGTEIRFAPAIFIGVALVIASRIMG